MSGSVLTIWFFVVCAVIAINEDGIKRIPFILMAASAVAVFILRALADRSDPR